MGKTSARLSFDQQEGSKVPRLTSAKLVGTEECGVMTEPTATAPPVEEAGPSFEDLPTIYEMQVDQDNVAVQCEKDLLKAKIKDLASENRTLKEDYERVVLEKQKLHGELAKRLEFSHERAQESFEQDDDKVHYFTGMPCYAILMAVFKFLKLRITVHHRHSLSLFHQFLLVLMKLCLNCPDQDLAYRFNINQSTISRMFQRWISVMFTMMKPLIKWPERERERERS